MLYKYFPHILFLLSVCAICIWIGEKFAMDIPVFQHKRVFAASPNPDYCNAYRHSQSQNTLEECCRMLYAGNDEHVRAASTIHSMPDDSILLDRLTKCDRFFHFYPSYMNRMNGGRRNFSIAYAILAHRDLQHVERLLRMIYRPEHVYCIHVDKKSTGLQEKVDKLVRCLPNVFLSSVRHTVVWGGEGIIRATIGCLTDLVKRRDWSYFINLSAQDVPLKSNSELVRLLSSWRNRSSIEISGEAQPHKVHYEHETRYNRFGNADSIYRTGRKKQSPPYNVTVMKGNLAVVLARQLAEWIVASREAARLLEYLSDAANPDEYFWQTLVSNRFALGLDEGRSQLTQSYHVRYAVWKGQREMCRGKFVRDVCVFGAGDVKRLINIRKYLFANKLYLGYQTPAYECIAARHMARSEADDRV